ncbi:MAG TPA: outer membrane beta-barrel protein [Sulfuriferula sp.]|nr:outer membrane beta-barrel protein [Sulfuriferula sp.]
MTFSRKKIAVLISLAFCAPETVLADQPVVAPLQTQGQGQSQSPGILIRQEANPTAPVSPLSPADLLRPEALSGPKPQAGGLRVGSFLFYPDISVTELYDDNIYSDRTRETSDWVTIFSPTLSVRSDWARHSLNFWAGADMDRYQSHTTENVTDRWFEAQGRYDISKKTNVYGGAGISRNHEDRYNIDPARAGGLEPTRFWETKGHVGVFHQFDKASIRVGTTYEHLDYSNVPASGGGILVMDDRDRKLYSVGGRFGYKLTPKYTAFAQLATDTRRYDLAGVGRDSDGYRLAAGLSADFGGKNTAEVFIGHMQQNYDNAALTDVSKPYFGADAKFAVGPTTYVTAFVDRSLEETTIAGASSYLDTTVGARVDHDVSQNLSFNGRLALTKSQFQGTGRVDDYLDAGFGAKYYVSKDIYLAADYRLLLRQSSEVTPVVNGVQNTFDFARNQIFVSAGYTPGRVPRAMPATSARLSDIFLATADTTGLQIPVDAIPDYSGFYLGAQAGYGSLMTEAFSTRSGGGGTDEMDMGKQGGVTEGLFAGYGWMLNRWYYGLELEAEDSNASWYHQKVKGDARTMSLEKNRGYGASLRGGYALDGGLLYGRLGLVRTNFHTYETENQYAATGAYNQDQTLNGTRYGVGVDIPASERLFVRMDYSYTHYGNYDASYQTSAGGATSTDKFDNAESLFRVGLGWRFGGQVKPIPKVDAASVSGFYAGAKVGHGSLTTRLDAIHNDGGGAGCSNCAFTGDFGKLGGTWGFFAGYGWTFNRVYLGLDLEAESSNTQWFNNRDSSGGGRDVSVQKKGSYGAGVRLGYVLNNGSLLYARAGQVRTRFNTLYVKGNNAAAWVDRDDVLKGNRLSIGAEVPAYRNLFVKMEYAVTNYGDYGFTTTQANADTPNFKNRDNLFSLGLGLRF